jgi:hypothetical protein
MMVVRYSNEVLKLIIIYQKFDIPGTYMRTFVEDERLDLSDFLPDGFFLTIGLQNRYYSCRLAYSKCLGTSVFLHMAGKILIYVLMFIYDSGGRRKCCSYIKHFRWSICMFSYSYDRYFWRSKICITEVKKQCFKES